VRLLFDEQLSEELVTALHDLFPDSLHVRLLVRAVRQTPSSGNWLAIMAACS
jgi:hypothetical protein